MHRVGRRALGYRPLPRRDLLEGSVDDLGRPLVRIDVPGFSDPLVGYIDTGFNGALIVDETQAKRLGFNIFNQRTEVRLASQRREEFLLGRGEFPWLGRVRAITAYVLIEAPEERRARIARKTEEEILVGTELLSECQLEINFPARRVTIRQGKT